MAVPDRETLLELLYEAAELEHNLVCTCLHAAFSLKDGEAEGLSREQAEAVRRWRREIVAVAAEEVGHRVAMWNLTAAPGGAPRSSGRQNRPNPRGKASSRSAASGAAAPRRGSRRWPSTTKPSVLSILGLLLTCGPSSTRTARPPRSAAIRRCRSTRV